MIMPLLPAVWAECTKFARLPNTVLSSQIRRYFLLPADYFPNTPRHFKYVLTLKYFTTIDLHKGNIQDLFMNKIINFYMTLLAKFQMRRRKYYFFHHHFCILLIGLQVFFIYQRFPCQSKIYILSERI